MKISVNFEPYGENRVFEEVYGYIVSSRGNLSVYRTLSDSINREPLITYAKGYWRTVEML